MLLVSWERFSLIPRILSGRAIRRVESRTQRSGKARKNNCHVAVSAALAEEFPTLPPLLRSIAEAPSSCLHFYLSEKKLCKFVTTSTKEKPEMVRRRMFQRACVLSKPEERETAKKKYKDLYIHPRSFILRIDGRVEAICPGCPQRP